MDAKIFTFDRQSHGSCLGGLLKANEKEVDNFEWVWNSTSVFQLQKNIIYFMVTGIQKYRYTYYEQQMCKIYGETDVNTVK